VSLQVLFNVILCAMVDFMIVRQLILGLFVQGCSQLIILVTYYKKKGVKCSRRVKLLRRNSERESTCLSYLTLGCSIYVQYSLFAFIYFKVESDLTVLEIGSLSCKLGSSVHGTLIFSYQFSATYRSFNDYSTSLIVLGGSP
jgi:hypothetical protein